MGILLGDVTRTSVYLFKNQHVLIIFIIERKNTMRMLIALTLLLAFLAHAMNHSHPPDPYSFLIFSNDGTFYKIDPEEQNVYWRSDFGSKLISFEISETGTPFDNDLSTYFIPTIEGHFVYIAKNTQILVHREQIQPLLKICFGKSTSAKELVLSEKQKYFLHQKFEYFFLDLHNGKLWSIQKFFEEKVIAKQGRHALIKVSKKFLKQLKTNFQVKWSVISSKIDIISAVQFLKNPKSTIETIESVEKKYQFQRISNHQLDVIDLQSEKRFQMGSSSPIMAVFSCSKNGSSFKRYPIEFYKKPLLAIQDKHLMDGNKGKNQVIKAGLDVFPHTSEIRNSNRSNKKAGEIYKPQKFDFQYCLNTFRAIQQLHSESHSSTDISFVSKKLQIGEKPGQYHENSHNLPPSQMVSPISHPHLFRAPERSEDQPLIWIFIIGSLIVSGILFYRFKVSKLLTELEKLQTEHDKRFEEIQKKLGQFEEMQKMYEVYWDKLLYRKPRRKPSDAYIDETNLDNEGSQTIIRSNEIEMYEHLVFQGRFLNKESLVYAVPMDGIDLIHIEHQLNDLLSCSHKSLAKLYYYTKNSQFLLIFCEKIKPQWKSIEESDFFFKFINKQSKTIRTQQNTVENNANIEENGKQPGSIVPKEQLQKKLSILTKEIIECVSYVDSKIQIFSLPLQGIILNYRSVGIIEKDGDKSTLGNFQIDLKINAIPSILQVCRQEEDYSEQTKLKSRHYMNLKLRHDLVKIFYFINSNGEKSNIKVIQSMITKNENSVEDNFFVKDFYDFVLNENYNLNIEIETTQKMESKEEEKKVRSIGWNFEFLSNLVCHPFLWDSKRKILFLTDFSNYIETYLDDFKIKKLESYAKDYQIIDTPWTKHLDVTFVREVNQFRKYDFNSVKDLIRLIRNKLNHFHEIPKETRTNIGKTPQAFIEYMLKLYPKLLSFAFVYAKKKKWKLHVQMK